MTQKWRWSMGIGEVIVNTFEIKVAWIPDQSVTFDVTNFGDLHGKPLPYILVYKTACNTHSFKLLLRRLEVLEESLSVL